MLITNKQAREYLENKIAQNLADNAELDDLVQFYYDHQLEWLSSMTDEEFINEAAYQFNLDTDDIISEYGLLEV